MSQLIVPPLQVQNKHPSYGVLKWRCVACNYSAHQSRVSAFPRLQRFVLPFNPRRLGCQVAFPRLFGTVMAAGGRDHLVTRCLTPERERERQTDDIWEGQLCYAPSDSWNLSRLKTRCTNSPQTCSCKLAHSRLLLAACTDVQRLPTAHVSDRNVLNACLPLRVACVTERHARAVGTVCALATREFGGARHFSRWALLAGRVAQSIRYSAPGRRHRKWHQ